MYGGEGVFGARGGGTRVKEREAKAKGAAMGLNGDLAQLDWMDPLGKGGRRITAIGARTDEYRLLHEIRGD